MLAQAEMPASTDAVGKPFTTNAPAQVVEFREDAALVRLLAPLGTLPEGWEGEAALRSRQKVVVAGAEVRTAGGRSDFATLRKLGLRVGGAVDLVNVRFDGDGRLTAYRVEVLKKRPDLLGTLVAVDMLVSLVPPDSQFKIAPEHALLALREEAEPVDGVTAAVEVLERVLRDDTGMGRMGAVMRGPDPDGGMAFKAIMPGEVASTGEADVQDAIRRFLTEGDKEILKKARHKRVRHQWEVVPLVQLPVNAEHTGRFAAALKRLGYRTPDGLPLFAESTVLLSADETGAWTLSYAGETRSPATLVGLDWPTGFRERAPDLSPDAAA